MKKPIFFVVTLLVLTVLACSFNASTANISDAKLAKDPDGAQPATTFAQDEPFYCVVQLANAPDDTKVKAAWTVVEAQDTEPNVLIDEAEISSGDGQIHFDLTNDKLWPAGQYKVDLYLNDKLDRTLEFQVEASAVAAEPTPTAEPTEEPTATPELEPTSEPTTEPTEELTVEPTEENAAGDVITLPTGEATEESQYEPLPFKEDPYVHPSKAFTFLLPESFEGIAGDKTSVSFGNDQSVVGAAFLNAGVEFSDKEMQDFIDAFTESFMANFSDDHKVLEQKTTEDGSIFEAVSYESPDGDGDADFIFEQRDNIVFVLYFVSTTYAEMEPTWHEIIDSYSVDPQAALAAAPESGDGTPTDPTPAPAPKPTQPPAPAGPAIPGGKGMLTYNNQTDVDFVIDVIGPTNASQVVPPGQVKEFILDPGHYTINAHSAGGKYYVPSYEFDIAAGQLLRDGVQ
jgi:hypothetical protein